MFTARNGSRARHTRRGEGRTQISDENNKRKQGKKRGKYWGERYFLKEEFEFLELRGRVKAAAAAFEGFARGLGLLTL